MSTESGGARISTEHVRNFVTSMLDAYRGMGIGLAQYAWGVLLPTFVFAVGSVVGLAYLPVPLEIGLPIAGLGVFSFTIAVAYPKVVQDRQKKEVRERYHLFVTHITVLSMTNIDRVEIFRTLADEDEYKSLAVEMGHLVALVDTFNQSLEDACRIRAKKVASPLLSNFFERLAYTVGAGQAMDEFLINEQDSIIQQFVTRYESDLTKIDVLKELYLSLMLSSTFILVFAIVIPLLIGINPAFAVGGVAALFVVVQTGFVFTLHTVSPYDPIWFRSDSEGHPLDMRFRIALAVGAIGSLVAIGVTYAILTGRTPYAPDVLPLPIFMALPFTPLLIPGLAIRAEENRIKERDEEFPRFIRALGAVESVKQTSTANVLATLRKKDFGSLTASIDALYKRLSMRIDDTRSWRLFAAENGSYLIQKFGDMYVLGRSMGGDPNQLGQVISRNLSEVAKLRDKRGQATSTFIGVVYGLTASSAFAFFVGIEVVELLIQISESMNLDSSMMSFLLNSEVYNLPLIEYLLLLVLLLNCLLSAVMIRVIDRGHLMNSYVHFVMLSWVAAVTGVLTREAVGALITI
ncbi:archaellar assembly protein FlaJ [Haladaptatus sp. CMSO5]|uniref:archaellar assembly protein FlaJ n=1 Tax=Haladaptatus sp. CMSO5 TaxID=3120514 RepID=UPI002FCDEEED